MKQTLLTIATALVAATALHAQTSDDLLRKLQMAELAVTNLYVDTVDENKLVEEAITGMLLGLDPHSTYNNAEEVKKMNEPLQG
ncbi:MAG: peptidase S41, partial [Prevotellaceae bacterium]|nr:peptidase S41 [Prevotellaceae bacterium]